MSTNVPPTASQAWRIALSFAARTICIAGTSYAGEIKKANPQLKIVANMAVGYNNFDVPAMTAAGVVASNTPDVLTETTADFGFALLMATARRICESEHYLRAGHWTKWSYDMGVVLKGFESLWMRTGNVAYYNSIKNRMDYFVQNDGSIKGYEKEEYNIDHVNNGKLVLLLYRVTGKEKYKKAADLLRSQLTTHPRTNEGGFWHKKIYICLIFLSLWC